MSLDESIAVAVERAAEKVLAKVAEHGKPRLMNRSGAARYMGCHPTYLDELERDERIKPVCWNTEAQRKTKFYDVRDLDSAIERAKEA